MKFHFSSLLMLWISDCETYGRVELSNFSTFIEEHSATILSANVKFSDNAWWFENKIFPKKLGEWRMRCLTGSEGMLPKLSKAWTGAMVAKILVTKYSRMDQVKFVEDSL